MRRPTAPSSAAGPLGAVAESSALEHQCASRTEKLAHLGEESLARRLGSQNPVQRRIGEDFCVVSPPAALPRSTACWRRLLIVPFFKHHSCSSLSFVPPLPPPIPPSRPFFPLLLPLRRFSHSYSWSCIENKYQIASPHLPSKVQFVAPTADSACLAAAIIEGELSIP